MVTKMAEHAVWWSRVSPSARRRRTTNSVAAAAHWTSGNSSTPSAISTAPWDSTARWRRRMTGASPSPSISGAVRDRSADCEAAAERMPCHFGAGGHGRRARASRQPAEAIDCYERRDGGEPGYGRDPRCAGGTAADVGEVGISSMYRPVEQTLYWPHL